MKRQILQCFLALASFSISCHNAVEPNQKNTDNNPPSIPLAAVFTTRDTLQHQASIFRSGETFYLYLYLKNKTLDTLTYTNIEADPRVSYVLSNDTVSYLFPGYGSWLLVQQNILPGDSLVKSWPVTQSLSIGIWYVTLRYPSMNDTNAVKLPSVLAFTIVN